MKMGVPTRTLNCFLLTGIILIALGCADKDAKLEDLLDETTKTSQNNLPHASGGLVLSVAGETVSSDELINPMLDPFQKTATSLNLEQFKKTATPQVEQLLMNRITSLLLYQKAVRQAGDNIDEMLEKAVESEVRDFVMGFNGDYAKAEAALKQKGMNWNDFRDYQKKLLLSQSYVSEQMPKEEPITYGQLRAYYDKIKDEQLTTEAKLEFKLIDIQPEKLKSSDQNTPQDQQAAELAEQLYQKIRDGESFEALAKKYSHGHRASYGGAWPSVNPDSLAAPYDKLAAKAAQMMPGQVSPPIQLPGHIFIMKLGDKQDYGVQSFESVQKQLEAMIMLDRRKAAVEKIGKDLAAQAGLTNKEQFLDYCVEQIYWQCNNRL